ncbi:MAG: RuBisCO large subunit C-terminal-like domain-containing protein [Gammaproteobacteria bacterium]|nr:RuBisCO large subunit C-terminal-like domain-containing protein [Gammaproteobacteria bacterium]
MSNIAVTYLVIAHEKEVSELARKIAIEQSVETPESLITPEIEARFVGKIEQINPVENHLDKFTITLSYPEEILSQQYNQLINLCFGNVSMYQNVKCIDVSLPEKLLDCFAGPRFGVEGIRECLGVYGRPLLATALKPRGYSEEQFANLAYEFAVGGGDIIKDDQNLIGDFEQFKHRVTLCLDAVKRAEDKTGKRCVYFPFISAPYEHIQMYFEWVKNKGIEGVLLAPLILGLDTARGLAAKYDLIYMAHPSFTGSNCIPPNDGMSYHLLYGLLFRLAGVDISVYPNTGGRFEFKENDCKAIAEQLRKPLAHIKPAFPCPAGGMQYTHLNEMCRWYKHDSVFLLGGSLLEYSPKLSHSTQAFKEKILEEYSEDIKPPRKLQTTSSCDYPLSSACLPLEHIRFNDFEWTDRNSVVYKDTNNTSFEGVRRIELVGNNGEISNFDLRYFEISQNGFSSKEKHKHTHVIIVIRGEGKIIIDNKKYRAKKNDILYVKPMAIHQLKNISEEPFGFYCIVDHDRDRPIISD